MEKLGRFDRLYIGINNDIESEVNTFLKCRDGSVDCYEYSEESGYGAEQRLFLCENSKHESIAIIRQTKLEGKGTDGNTKYYWSEDEEVMYFDSDSFGYLKGLILGNENIIGGVFTEVRNYNNEK